MTIDIYTAWVFAAGLLGGAGITLLVTRVIPDQLWLFRYLRRRKHHRTDSPWPFG